MTFRIGQPVVCIKAGGWRDLVLGETGPSFHQQLTIREMDDGPPGLTLRFEEIVNPILRYRECDCECSFNAAWFRPLIKKATDIGFAHEILRKTSAPEHERAEHG